MAQLGDVLTAPEAGWKSYSDDVINQYFSFQNENPHYQIIGFLTSNMISIDPDNYFIKVQVLYDSSK